MGFNIGALAGGISDGWSAGVDLRSKDLQQQLTQHQLQEYQNAQAAQRAFTNMLIPGAQPMPGTPQQPGSGLPTMAQLPIIGPISRGIESAGQAFGDFFGMGGQPQASSAPPQTGARPAMPQSAPAAPSGMGAVSAQTQAPAGPQTAALSGGTPGMPNAQMIAQAIDQANPGLKQRNPDAFAAAVNMGIQQIARFQDSQLAAAKTRAEIGDIESRGPLNKAKVETEGAKAGYYSERARNPSGKDPVKAVNDEIRHELTNNATQLRHYEDLKARALSAPVMTPQIKALVTEADGFIQAHRERDKILRSQLSTADLTKRPPGGKEPAAPPAMAPPTPEVQAKLAPIIGEMVQLSQTPEAVQKITALVKHLQSKGVPANEINFMLMEANKATSSPEPMRPERPQVPMSR